MPVRIVNSLENVPPEAWNRLAYGGNPFLRHEFLVALEREQCVGARTGWLSNHLLLEDEQGTLRGAIPLYRKSHSWGEFVFDWSWARAYDQAGLPYYPKLVSMTPFTPASSARLLVAAATDAAATRLELARALLAYVGGAGVSSTHLLFVTEEDRAALERAGNPLAQRLPVPLAQPRLRHVRRFPRDVSLGQAQEGTARAAADRRGGHHVRHAAR